MYRSTPVHQKYRSHTQTCRTHGRHRFLDQHVGSREAGVASACSAEAQTPIPVLYYVHLFAMRVVCKRAGSVSVLARSVNTRAGL